MIILDTNVVSELMCPEPWLPVVEWVRTQAKSELYTTSITVAEVLFGLERLTTSRRRNRIETAATEIFATFADHVLAFDEPAAAHYATIVARREQAGAPIGGFDAQIAALCRLHGATLATRNTKDFSDTGVATVDPWTTVDGSDV